jgi:inositol-pentakisphosphate 2-kinase
MDIIWARRSTLGSTNGNDEDDTVRQCQELVNSPGLVDYKYVAEGRANIVFSIQERRGTETVKGRFERTLLRVPKATTGVTPCDYESLQAFQKKVVEESVGRQHLVPQILISISAGVADLLNAEWAKGKTKSSRHYSNSSVIQAGYAMLVEDMSASPGYKVLEFKPKWLAQSPIAPADSKRCRTCAREAYRNSQIMAEGGAVSVPVCPLGLMDEDRAVVQHTIKRLAPEWSDLDHTRLLDAFEKSGILKKLREIQTTGDSGNAMLENPSSVGFGLAMTLRDCSCYVRMPLDTNNDVEVKLADTDKKNWEEKQMYWRKSHWNLVVGGWYTCTEQVDPPVVTECRLSRHHVDGIGGSK